MRVIKKQTITDAMLTTDVTETDYPNYNPGTTYALDAEIQVTTGDHTVYRSKQASNTGNTPEGSDTDLWWQRKESTNPWMMFNDLQQEQTTKTGTIEVTLETGQAINAIAFMNMDANTVDITITDPDAGVVYDETHFFQTLGDADASDWYAFYYGTVTPLEDLVIFDLPAYVDATIDLVITGSTDAKCGLCVVGQVYEIGEAEYGATYGISDYSTKEINPITGFTDLKEGPYIEWAQIELVLPYENFTSVKRILTDLRGVYSVWVMTQEIEGSLIYGNAAEFEVIISNSAFNYCNLYIEG